MPIQIPEIFAARRSTRGDRFESDQIIFPVSARDFRISFRGRRTTGGAV
jgi:hypothetical protein